MITWIIIIWVVAGLPLGWMVTQWSMLEDSYNRPPIPILRGLIIVAGMVFAPVLAAGCIIWLIGKIAPAPNYAKRKIRIYNRWDNQQ